MFGIASASKESSATNVSGSKVRPMLDETRRSCPVARYEQSSHLFSSLKGVIAGPRIFVNPFVTAVTAISHHGGRRCRLIGTARTAEGKSDHHPSQKYKHAETDQIRRMSHQLEMFADAWRRKLECCPYQSQDCLARYQSRCSEDAGILHSSPLGIVVTPPLSDPIRY